MRAVVSSLVLGLLAAGGAGGAWAQVGGQQIVTRAYTVEPYAPPAPVAIQGTGVRLRAEPFATKDTPVLSSGSTGLQLTVVGLVRQPDWAWYQVILRNGQKAFIRSDFTSAPMQGGSAVAVAAPVVAPLPPVVRPASPVAAPSTPTPPAPSLNLPLPASSTGPSASPALAPLPPATPVDGGLISIAPAAPLPRMTSTATLGQDILKQLSDKRCWTDSSSMLDAQRLKATFAVTFGNDGKFASEPVLIDPPLAPSNDPAMTVFIAKARAAMRTCNAFGFAIPTDYFAGANRPEVRLDFSAR